MTLLVVSGVQPDQSVCASFRRLLNRLVGDDAANKQLVSGADINDVLWVYSFFIAHVVSPVA